MELMRSVIPLVDAHRRIIVRIGMVRFVMKILCYYDVRN